MSNNSVCIVTHSYMRNDGSGLQIGGVQTYVGALCELLAGEGVQVDVLQLSAEPFEKFIGEKVKVIGVGGDVATLEKVYKSRYRGKYTLTLFAFFNWADWNSGERCIAIQHGVAIDGFSTRHRGLKAAAHKYYRAYEHWQERRATVRILNSIAHVICVDLNFSNWLRATFPFSRWEEKLTYVPNFGDPIGEEELNDKLNRGGDTVNILTARRFETFRGALFMGKIVKEIAADYPNAEFIFAGTGSDERELRSMLDGISNCKITEIPYQDMPEACLCSDIVAVPTLWSEGTSLSCIEGMCAGSAVVSTNIGGLSNLILNEFNGLIVEPTHEKFKDSLVRLLADRGLRRKLGKNAHVTAYECFSRQRWNNQVLKVLKKHLD